MKRKIPASILALLLCAALCAPVASARSDVKASGCDCSFAADASDASDVYESANQLQQSESLPQGAASAYAQELLALVNAARAQYGLAALHLDQALCDCAQRKAQDLHDARYFSHESARYGSAFDMMHTFGISYRTAGENLAMGYDAPAAVMAAWMQSATHRANILRSGYTTLGVGHVADGGYWAQWFIG